MRKRLTTSARIGYLMFWILIFSGTAIAQSTWYEVYFSQVNNNAAEAKANPQSIDRVLVQKLTTAQSSIDAALHEIDSERIAQALIAAYQRGVRVRVVTENDYMDEASIEALQTAGVPIVSDEGHSGLMHNKFLVIDRRYLWTGSFNTTDNGAYFDCLPRLTRTVVDVSSAGPVVYVVSSDKNEPTHCVVSASDIASTYATSC